MSQAPAAPNDTMGVLLATLGVSHAIYGATCYQVCQYFRRHNQSDNMILKGAVVLVWILESVNACITSYALYHYLILNRGNFSALMYINWGLSIPAGTNAFSGSIIQFFFAYRVYIMSAKNIYLTGTICAMSLTQFALGLGIMIQSLLHPGLADEYIFKSLVPSGFAITAATDVLITASLCYFLQIRKSGHSKTNGLVNSLITLTISNGVLSSTIAVLAFVFQLAMPKTMLSFAMCFLLGKAYSNTLLSSLNSRRSARERLSRHSLSNSTTSQLHHIKERSRSIGRTRHFDSSTMSYPMVELGSVGTFAMDGVVISREVEITVDP